MIMINIPMPNCCAECPLSDDSGDYPFCWALQENRGYTFDRRTKRFPNCPLKPIEKKTDDLKGNAYIQDMLRVLFNRCRAVGSGGGIMCSFCTIQKECRESQAHLFCTD